MSRKHEWAKQMRYVCHKCKKWVDAEDAVWVDPTTGISSTGDGSKPYHVECAPEEVLVEVHSGN